MDVSNYIIKTETDDGRILLFSTLTTSFIVLNKTEYDKIFVDKNFSECSHVAFLTEYGFLVNNKEDQTQLLDRLAVTEISRRDPVIKIFSTNRCNARCYYCF